jgi:hypothetical protein
MVNAEQGLNSGPNAAWAGISASSGELPVMRCPDQGGYIEE